MVQRISPHRPPTPLEPPSAYRSPYDSPYKKANPPSNHSPSRLGSAYSKYRRYQDGGENAGRRSPARGRYHQVAASYGAAVETLLFVLGSICITIFFLTYDFDAGDDEAPDIPVSYRYQSPPQMVGTLARPADPFHPHWDGKKCELSPPGTGALPSILVIGVHKGGSTALFSYLAAHGDVRPSFCKETHFLDWKYNMLIREWDKQGQGPPTTAQLKAEYARFFRPASEQPNTISIEGTPSYFFTSGSVAKRARQVVPDARLVVAMRNPIDRTISHFMGKSKYRDAPNERHPNCSSWFETYSTSLADRCDKLRPRRNGFSEISGGSMGPEMTTAWTKYAACVITESPPEEEAIARSLYAPQLFMWLQHYPKEQLYVIQSENLFYHTGAEMDMLTTWLGLRSHLPHERTNFVPIGSTHMKRFNQQYLTRNVGQKSANFAQRFDCSKQHMNSFYMKYEDDLWDLLRGLYPDELARWNKWSYQGGDRIVPPSHVHGHTRKASQQPVKRKGRR